MKDWEQAERGIAYMRSDMDGRATFLIHPEADETIPQASIASPARTAGHRGEAQRRSAIDQRTRRRSGRSAAQTFAMLHRRRSCLRHSDCPFSIQIRTSCCNDGVCYHGHAVSGGKKTGSGPLGLKRELREVSNQHTAKQKEFDKTKSLLEDLDLEMSQLTEDLERLRGQQQRQEKDAVSLDHEIRKMTEEFNRANSRLSVARTELQRLMQERERSAARREQNEKLVAEKEQARAGAGAIAG